MRKFDGEEKQDRKLRPGVGMTSFFKLHLHIGYDNVN